MNFPFHYNIQCPALVSAGAVGTTSLAAQRIGEVPVAATATPAVVVVALWWSGWGEEPPMMVAPKTPCRPRVVTSMVS